MNSINMYGQLISSSIEASNEYTSGIGIVVSRFRSRMVSVYIKERKMAGTAASED